jgi:hypothetical protein
MRYNANVSIRIFRERKDMDYRDLSHIPNIRSADLPRSRIQTVAVSLVPPLTLLASVVWKRVSE